MKWDKGLFMLVFAWLFLISFALVRMGNTQAFILGELCDIYDMLTGVYEHITNLLTMGVYL